MYIMRKLTMINGLIGTHLATGQDVSVSLNAKEMQLACDKTDSEKSWSLMNKSILNRTGIEIAGQVELYYIVINGITKDFH